MIEHRNEQTLEELVKAAVSSAGGEPDAAVYIIYDLFRREPELVDQLELDPVFDFAALVFRHFTGVPFDDHRHNTLRLWAWYFTHRKERAETFAKVRADELRRLFSHWYSEDGSDWGFPQNKDGLVAASVYAEVLWGTPGQTRDTIADEIGSHAEWLSDARLKKLVDDAGLPEAQALLSSSMIGARLGLRKYDVEMLRIRSIEAMG